MSSKRHKLSIGLTSGVGVVEPTPLSNDTEFQTCAYCAQTFDVKKINESDDGVYSGDDDVVFSYQWGEIINPVRGLRKYQACAICAQARFIDLFIDHGSIVLLPVNQNTLSLFSLAFLINLEFEEIDFQAMDSNDKYVSMVNMSSAHISSSGLNTQINQPFLQLLQTKSQLSKKQQEELNHFRFLSRDTVGNRKIARELYRRTPGLRDSLTSGK